MRLGLENVFSKCRAIITNCLMIRRFDLSMIYLLLSIKIELLFLKISKILSDWYKIKTDYL